MKKLNKQFKIIIAFSFCFCLTNNAVAQVNEFDIPTEMTGDSVVLSITNTGAAGSTNRLVKFETPNLSANQDVLEMIANPALNSQFIEFQQVGVTAPVGKINTDGSASFKGLNLGLIYSDLSTEILKIVTDSDDGISIIGDDTGDVFIKLKNSSTHEIYNDWSTDDLVFNAGAGEDISFRDGDLINMNLTGAGNLGLGTVSPVSKLDIHVDGYNGISVRGDGSSDTYLRIQNGADQHFLFSDQDKSNRFVLQSQNLRDIAFSTGLTTRIHVESNNGNVGIATESPTAKLHVNHNDVSTDGLRIENNASNNDWLINTSGINGELQLRFENIFKGSFDEITGAYTSASDKRLKKDIKNLDSVMSDIMKLRPAQYKFKSDKNQQNNIGLIAQEVQEIFPSAVRINHKAGKNSEDLLSISYTELIPVLIKGMQEQQAQIKAQQQLIDKLLKG
jgi:hypothetical protein